MRSAAFIPSNWKSLLVLAAVLAGLPMVLRNDYFLLLFNVMALNALVVLGLNLLIGSTGQVSLGHAAFYGLGAYISAVASTTYHWPLLPALLLALVLVGATAFLLALPTLRLEGHYLVMATLGFNIIVSILLGQLEPLTGGPSGFPGIPKIHLGALVLKSDREFYYFIWSAFLVIFALTLNLTNSRIGRALQAIHERELTAQALGIPSYRYKVATFVLSALYAAFAGFCYAHYVTFISPKTFDIFYSVQIVTMVVVGGMGSLWGGLAGTALLTVLPEILHHFEDLQVLLYGLILMAVLVFLPQGLAPAVAGFVSSRVRWAVARFSAKSSSESADSGGSSGPGGRRIASGSATESVPAAADGDDGAEPVLEVLEISLDFGGLQALTEMSMQVRPGEIVALIGPNGAGKTTLLNVVSGLLKPISGQIRLNGKDILGLAPHEIAVRGIGRTFQAVQIFQKFSVLENVLLGYHTRGRSGFAASYLHSPSERKEECSLRESAVDLLERFGMGGKVAVPVQQLDLLDQKLLEIARALALSPSVLLFDEPAGGLNPRESEYLMDHISALKQAGVGIIFVEHDMNMVMRLADRIYVLQHGRLIASGRPREIQKDPKVIAAYLGTKRFR